MTIRLPLILEPNGQDAWTEQRLGTLTIGAEASGGPYVVVLYGAHGAGLQEARVAAGPACDPYDLRPLLELITAAITALQGALSEHRQ